MASPLTVTPHDSSWMGGVAQPAPHPNDADDFGFQVRSMGLKVQYTFDKNSQVNCLARWPQLLQVQTLQVDEKNWIGVVDLRLCVQSVAQGSPEIVGRQEHDYNIYAVDYSEPDTPLVGQGMLSWSLGPVTGLEEPKMVPGRVTKNLLPVFGSRETLEVKLKLIQVPKIPRADSFNHMDTQQSMLGNTSTPIDTTEWNSFIQSNPTLGRSASIAAVGSPMGHGVPDMPLDFHMDTRSTSRPCSVPPQLAAAPRPRGGSVSVVGQVPMLAPASALSRAPSQSQEAAEEDVSAGTLNVEVGPKEGAPKPSRPSSRASTRKSRATGRPRGRPRKKPAMDGNTSAAEELPTDADEGPKKKRAKTTKADYPTNTPLDAAPESLRVAASTSGALRTLRPVLAAGEGPSASHLQDIPRAPTPVPQAPLPGQQRKRPVASKSRRESMASFDVASYPQLDPNSQTQFSQAQDARSPTESLGQSPYNYTPEDSPADLGSSPPVPRSVAYMQSSPMQLPSSPILPPMPKQQPDSGFMSGGMDDIFDDEDFLHTLPMQPPQELPLPVVAVAKLGVAKPAARKQKPNPQDDMPFQVVNPGPPELLPATSLYNPPFQRRNSTVGPKDRATAPELKRAHTEPSRKKSEDDTPTMSLSQPKTQLSEAHFPEVEEANMGVPTPATVDAPDAAGLPNETTDELPNASTARQTQLSELPANPEAVPESETFDLPPPPSPSRKLAKGSSKSVAFPAVAASDPAAMNNLTLPPLPPPTAFSEAPCPPSDALDGSALSKNLVKKQTIKNRLQKAIESGEMPTFCQNCGAIETPTWRKMWTQDHNGQPQFYEFSEKPGCVTAIEILERDSDGKPTTYRLIKKNLGPTEVRTKWTEMLLCNPCGLWLGKCKSHRPPDRWEKDAARLNQPPKRRQGKGNNGGNSRSKKQKLNGQMHPTSEAYFTTDPIGPSEAGSPDDMETDPGRQIEQHQAAGCGNNQAFRSGSNQGPAGKSSPNRQGLGSTHSRASGAADSPIPVDDNMGGTRRLLFPSPRKDGVPKVLGEVELNVVRSAADAPGHKEAASDKENVVEKPFPATPSRAHDDLDDLFGTPPVRPSTPTSKATRSGGFKTPTRPTPSHRPITRSVSKSIRSVTSATKSPSQAILHLQRTPSKTPRSTFNLLGSASKRRTPALPAYLTHLESAHFQTPFTATLNQLLSEANDFTAGSSAHGLADLDLSSLPNLDSDKLSGVNHLDFGDYLNTDMPMPSSPPLLGRSRGDQHVSFEDDMGLDNGENLWSRLSEAIQADGSRKEDGF